MAEDIFVGSVAVGVVPDARGWNDKLRQQIVDPSAKIGDDAGKKISDAIDAQLTKGGEKAARDFADAFKAKIEEALKNLPDADIHTYGTTDALEKIGEIKAALRDLGTTSIIDKDRAVASLDVIMLKVEELRLEAAKGIDIPISSSTMKSLSELSAMGGKISTVGQSAVSSLSAGDISSIARAVLSSSALASMTSVPERAGATVAAGARADVTVGDDLAKAVAQSMNKGMTAVSADMTKAIAKTFVGGSGVIPAGGVAKVLTTSISAPISSDMKDMVDAINSQNKVFNDMVDASKQATSVGMATANIVKAATSGAASAVSAVSTGAAGVIDNSAVSAADILPQTFSDFFSKNLSDVVDRMPLLSQADALGQRFANIQDEMRDLYDQKIVNPDDAIKSLDSVYQHLQTLRADFKGSLTPVIDTATQNMLYDILKLASDVKGSGTTSTDLGNIVKSVTSSGSGGISGFFANLFGSGAGGGGGDIVSALEGAAAGGEPAATEGVSTTGLAGIMSAVISPEVIIPIVIAILPYTLSLIGGIIVGGMGTIIAGTGVMSALSSGVLSPLTSLFTQNLSEAFSGIGDKLLQAPAKQLTPGLLSQGLTQAGISTKGLAGVRPQELIGQVAQQGTVALRQQPSQSILGKVITQATAMLRTIGGFLTNAMDILAGPLGSFLSANIKAFQSAAFGNAIGAIAKGFASILNALTPNISLYVQNFADALTALSNTIAKNPQSFVDFINWLNDMIDDLIKLINAGASTYNWLFPSASAAQGATPADINRAQSISSTAHAWSNIGGMIGSGGLSKIPGLQFTGWGGQIVGSVLGSVWGHLFGPSGGTPSTKTPQNLTPVINMHTGVTSAYVTGVPTTGIPPQTASLMAAYSPLPGAKSTIPAGTQQQAQQFVAASLVSGGAPLNAAGQQLVAQVNQGIGIGWRAVHNFFTGTAPANLAGWFKNMGGNLIKNGEDLITGFMTGLGVGWRGVHDFLDGSIWNDIDAWFQNQNPGTYLQQYGQQMVTGFYTGVTDTWRLVHDFLDGTIWNNLNGWFQNQHPLTYLYAYGEDLIQGLFNGMQEYTATNGPQFVNKYIVTPITNYLTNSQSGFGIASPAKKMKPVGVHIIQGIVHGMMEEGGKIDKFVIQIFKNWPNAIANFISRGWVKTSQLSPKAIKTLQSGFNKLGAAGQAVWANVFGTSKVPGMAGPAGVGATAGEMANGRQLYNYLLNNVFAGNKIAAAGATASIWGESTWNPFAQGMGGRGLIGWTPMGTISDAAFKGGMKTQLPAIIDFITSSGDWGVIANMKKAKTVTDAAYMWGQGVERYGIPDVHPTGIKLASSFMDQGGWLPPGATMVYNMTGKPEAVFNQEQLNALGSGTEYHAHFDGLTLATIESQVRQAFHLMSLNQGVVNRQGRRS